MTEKMKLDGIYPPLITPLRQDGSVDHDALADLVERLIGAGVHGLVSGGSTGEAYAMTVAERVEIARFVKERAAGRVPVIVGTGAMTTPDSIAIAQAAREMGADALLVGTPPYSVPTEYENAMNVRAIDRAADLPIILYNFPARMGVNMGREFLDLVCTSPNVIGIKESSGDINRLHLLAGEYTQLQIGCGMDDQALEFFAWGAPCWICAGSNFLPEEHIYLWETCASRGDFATGRRIMGAMMPLMHVLEQSGKFIQNVKCGVELSGLRAGPMRPPLTALDESEAQALKAVVDTLKTTIGDIKAGN